MTNDDDLSPNLSENDVEEEEQQQQQIKNNGNLSQLSLSPSSEINAGDEEEEDEEIEENLPKTDDLPSELHDQIDEVLHIYEPKEVNGDDDDDELIKFIKKARDEDFNCLDLSKKDIHVFPQVLLEFPSLQYLYLEGNRLKELPEDLFLCLMNLKWIDLRNNQLTCIPTHGLDRHTALRYLLLGGNLIRTLPAELGKVKGLSALNLDGNPLDDPPLKIIKQGIKAIQQYLCDGQIQSDQDDNDDQVTEIIADVWASSDEENKEQRRRSRSPHPTRILTRSAVRCNRNSKSETDYYKTSNPKLLTTHLQSCIQLKRVSYSEMRMRSSSSVLPRAKSDLKLPRVKLTKKISTDPIAETYAVRADEEQRLRRLKHRNMKINEELQKVKDREYFDQWKEDYRTSQQQLRRKHLIKGKDYQEAVVQAPFGIDPHYIPVMDKKQQEMLEKAIQHESRRNRSPESMMREEEERRIRDRQVQDRIREITGQMLKRRNGVRGNALEEKRQAEVELRELRKLEAEVKQRRAQIDKRFKAYTGVVKSRKKL